MVEDKGFENYVSCDASSRERESVTTLFVLFDVFDGFSIADVVVVRWIPQILR